MTRAQHTARILQACEKKKKKKKKSVDRSEEIPLSKSSESA